MRYTLYTLVDISHTNHHKNDTTEEALRWREQNFQTVLQTLGIRANVSYDKDPQYIVLKGRDVGFDTDYDLKVWRFDFETERESLYEKDSDPVGFLKDDFHLVPYIGGLGESMEQKYAVFNCHNPGSNIVFHTN